VGSRFKVVRRLRLRADISSSGFLRWYDGEREIVFVTTHVVSLKLFRLSFDFAQDGESFDLAHDHERVEWRSRTKGQSEQKSTIVQHFVEETVASRRKHGLKINCITVFP
jgi:hypothetical protein